MNFLITSTKLRCTLVLAIMVALANYSNAQYCSPPINNIEICYKTENDFLALSFICSKTNDTKSMAMTIESVTGGTAPYSISTISGSTGKVSETVIAEGGSFIYSFTSADFQDERLGFQIKDQMNKTVNFRDGDIVGTIFSNVFSVDCTVPYFLVRDNTTIEAGENATFTATKCILLDHTFEVNEMADFQAQISN